MADAIGSHLRDLESEARDAEKEVEDYRTRTQRRMDIMNAELKQLIAKYQSEKAIIQEHIQRKQLYAQRKQEEYENFRVFKYFNCGPHLETNFFQGYSTQRPLKPHLHTYSKISNFHKSL
jgi:hypothetical protein